MTDNQQPQSVLDRLGGKVSQLLIQIQDQKAENEMLTNEVVTLKAQNEAYLSRIERLEADISAKEREIEEIVNKIESILG